MAITIKAGDTFSYAGTVSGLPAGYSWTATCDVCGPSGALTSLDVTLAQAPDYSTSGAWVLTLFAGAAVTIKWGGANMVQTFVADVKFTGGAPDPVVHSETFVIQVLPAVTP